MRNTINNKSWDEKTAVWEMIEKYRRSKIWESLRERERKRQRERERDREREREI